MGTGLDSHMVEHHLAEEMGSISVARQVARDTLMTWGYRGRFEDVLLVVSEMVTNALVHGAGAPVLRIAGWSRPHPRRGRRLQRRVAQAAEPRPVRRLGAARRRRTEHRLGHLAPGGREGGLV
ncbi:hypothetical protein ACFSTC_31090 [Nonomuraea ferruginea]